MRKTTNIWLSTTAVAIIGTILFFYSQNNWIQTTEITFSSERIPHNLDGYRIVQLSDLHNKSFGDGQGPLVKRVRDAEPDLIVFTGDLIDGEKYDEEPSLILMEALVELAPVYFVTGNHEGWSGKITSLEGKLLDLGVVVLRNGAIEIGNEGDEPTMIVVGIDDPAMGSGGVYGERATTEDGIVSALEGLPPLDGSGNGESGPFQILLAHRPEMLDLYAEHGFDLVFSGHAHGGQVRLPFVGGLVAPNQGFLPEYTAGKYQLDGTTMVVNRGLGNSIIPLRVFNRPEIVVVTLEASEDRKLTCNLCSE